jgi:hypothetical protein
MMRVLACGIQPWVTAAAKAPSTCRKTTKCRYSGNNVLILCAVIERGFAGQSCPRFCQVDNFQSLQTGLDPRGLYVQAVPFLRQSPADVLGPRRADPS